MSPTPLAPRATSVKPSRPETMLCEPLTGQASRLATSCHSELPSMTASMPSSRLVSPSR